MKNFNENLVKGEAQNNMNFDFLDYPEVEEYRLEHSDDFDAIEIDFWLDNLNVTVSRDGSDYVEAHLYGKSKCPEKITLDTYVDKRVLHIDADFESEKNEGEVTLDVTVPQKKLRTLAILTDTSNINLWGIEAEWLRIINVKGAMQIRNVTYKRGIFLTDTGRLDLIAKAQDYSKTKLQTVSGEVMAQFLNVGKIEFDLKAAQGPFYNCHEDDGDYEAKVFVQSVSGTVWIG